MKPVLMDMGLLCCPECRGDLRLEEESREGEEIMEGRLSCQGCSKQFPILRGVPRLVPGSVQIESLETADSFGFEWERFHALDQVYEQQFLDWIAPVTRDFFKGKIILEGGCGKGRHTSLASRFGAKEIVAVDLSSAVDVCFRNCGRDPGVHVLQADMLRLPLKQGFDYAFSVGVLHHLPDPRAGFLSLASMVRPKGAVSAWVYGAEGNAWITRFVDPIRKHLTSRVPRPLLYGASWFFGLGLWMVLKTVYGPVSKTKFLSPLRRVLFYYGYLSYITRLPFSDIHAIVFDHLVPSLAFYIPQDDVKEWYSAAGVSLESLEWHNKNSWRAFGKLK